MTRVQNPKQTWIPPIVTDRPFGCPPDKLQSREEMLLNVIKSRCSCGSKLKTVGTVDGERKCGRCFREMMRQARPAKRSKYGVDISPAGKLRRTRIINGKPHVFHSDGEAKRYDQLALQQQQRYIRGLELQPDYPIWINDKHVCNVVLDFRYFEGNTRQVEDFKGKDNPLSRLKRKLVEAAYPGTKVKVVK